MGLAGGRLAAEDGASFGGLAAVLAEQACRQRRPRHAMDRQRHADDDAETEPDNQKDGAIAQQAAGPAEQCRAQF